MTAGHDSPGPLAWWPPAEREHEYTIGQRVEVTDGETWMPATIAGRFIGPVSGRPVYILAFATGHTDGTYASELRPVPA